MGNATLWEISNEMQKMDLWLDEIDEAEESEELKTEKEKMWLDVMVTLELMLKEKNVNIVRYILGLNKKTEIISDEIKRLQALKKQAENRADKMVKYVSDIMLRLNYSKIETDFGTFSFRKSESVDIENATLIPKEFTTTKIEISPDKTAIKKAIKEGKIVPGAVLLQKQNLQIK